MANGYGKSKKRGSGKRELVDTGTDKRYVRRNSKGQFDESDDVGRSLSKDVRKNAKTKVKPGYGDQGDQPRKVSTGSKKKASQKSSAKKSAKRGTTASAKKKS